jgi:disulfide bond formation protein DsbB
MKEKFIKTIKDQYIYFVFIFSFFATAGSLGFEFIINLPPCSLCIYQRIFMYPLLALTTLTILFKKKLSIILIFLMTIPGMFLAAYHVYVQTTGTKILIGDCTPAVPCNVIDYQLFGFLTIPMMSFLAFTSINIILVLAFYWNRKNKFTESII